MIVIPILWLIFVAFCAWVGHGIFARKGQNPLIGAVITGVVAFFFTPLVGFITLIALQLFLPSANKAKRDYGIGGGGSQMQGTYGPQITPSYLSPQPKVVQPYTKSSDQAARLKDLELLKKEDMISESEYIKMKNEILRQ